MGEHRLRVSKGNSKLGAIPSISLPAVKTCAQGVPCTKQCYVVKNMYSIRPNILKSHQANLDLLNYSRNLFFKQVSAYLDKHDPPYFRIHVAGDYVDAEYFHRWMVTARIHPETRFLSFTKAFHLLPVEAMIHIIPDNLAVIASCWPGYVDPPKGYRVAWMQDGNEHRVPSDAIECPGLCESCGLCWDLPDLGRDVVFRKH